MKFTKIKKGEYSFKGIDNWSDTEIQGHIIYQPYDVKSNEVWSVVFGLNTSNVCHEFYSATLKGCKDWLIK